MKLRFRGLSIAHCAESSTGPQHRRQRLDLQREKEDVALSVRQP